MNSRAQKQIQDTLAKSKADAEAGMERFRALEQNARRAEEQFQREEEGRHAAGGVCRESQ